MNRYTIRTYYPNSCWVYGVGELFTRIRNGAVWYMHNTRGNYVELARRLDIAHSIWETP